MVRGSRRQAYEAEAIAERQRQLQQQTSELLRAAATSERPPTLAGGGVSGIGKMLRATGANAIPIDEKLRLAELLAGADDPHTLREGELELCGGRTERTQWRVLHLTIEDLHPGMPTEPGALYIDVDTSHCHFLMSGCGWHFYEQKTNNNKN